MNGDCNICINGKRPSYSASCVECGLLRKNYKPMTNADRIRRMTDEELAKLFVSGWFDGPLFTCPVKDVECESDISCDACFMEWIKAPVEERG